MKSLAMLGAVAGLTLVAAPATAATVIDYVFVMDSSGSLGSFGWSQEKTFVSEVIRTNLHPSSAVGLVSFSTNVSSYPIVPLANGGSAAVRTQVNALPYLAQNTSTLAAMQAAVNLFTSYGHAENARVVMLITDGAPNPSSQNPCSQTSPAAASLRAALGANHIRTALVTIGHDIDPTGLGCLTDGNDADLVTPTIDYDNAFLPGVNARALALLTPATDPVAVPEPSTWALMLSGFAALGARIRARRRAATVAGA